MAYVEPTSKASGTALTAAIWNQDVVANEIALKALIDALTAASLPTGFTSPYVGTTAPSGFVLLDGKTIGDGSSGGTERANADCEDLFTLLWESMADAEAPVIGGRGASAAADWAAHKPITLPDARGRVIAAKDNLGGSAASRLTAAGSGITASTLGTSGGTETHTLTAAETAAHTHTGTAASDGAHTHTVTAAHTSHAVYGGATTSYGAAQSAITSSAASPATHTHTVSVDANVGGDGPHLNTQPTLVLSMIIKL